MDNQISPVQVHLATKKDCYDLKFFLENRLPESCDVSNIAGCYDECVSVSQLTLFTKTEIDFLMALEPPSNYLSVSLN